MPPNFLQPLHRRRIRLLVLWLLAIVLPLQGFAVVALAALGPLHVHWVVANAPIVLEDFRHWKTHSTVLETHGFGVFGHVHVGAAAQRHHHPLGDVSIVSRADEAPSEGDVITLAGLTLIAPAPRLAPWRAPDLVDHAIPGAPWSPRSGHVEPLERPPKRG